MYKQCACVWINLVLLNLQILTCIILWPNRINLKKWVMKSYLNPSPAVFSKPLPSHCCKTKRSPLITKYLHSKFCNRQAECLLRGMKWIFVYNIKQLLSFKAMYRWGSQSLGCNYNVLGSIPGQSMWDSGRVFGFPLSVSFHQRFILIFIYMLLLPEGQKA